MITLHFPIKTAIWQHTWSRILPLITVSFVGLVYRQTMAPTIFAWDSAELITGAYSLGIVHAPGYPVYLLIAHLFTYLPFGDVAYRVNLLSVCSTLITLYFFIHFLRPLIQSQLTRLLSALTLAFSFHVWSLSLFAEVYTLQMLFLMLTLLWLQRWRTAGQWVALLGAAWLMGVAAANSPATVLWWLGLIWLACTTPHFAPRFRHWQSWVKIITMGMLGLGFLLYLPLRSAANPALHYVGYWDIDAVYHPLSLTQLDNLIWYLSGKQFAQAFGSYSIVQLWREIGTFLHHLTSAFMGIGIPLGCWGIWHLWRINRPLLIGLLLTLLPHTLFFIGYNVMDKETMFLPTYLIWAIFLAIGLEQLRRMLPARMRPILVAFPLAFLLLNWSYVDVSTYRDSWQTAQTRLEESEPNAMFVADWGDASAMQYFQIIHGLRHDVTVINPFFLSRDTTLTMLIEAQIEIRPIHVTQQAINNFQFHIFDKRVEIQP